MKKRDEERETLRGTGTHEQDRDPRYQRYLRAKRTVDDRALSRRILAELAIELGGTRRDRLQLLDVACGTGAMFERLTGLGFLSSVDYVGLDRLPANIELAKRHSVPPGVSARWIVDDVFDFAEKGRLEPVDGLIACAFLDLFALDEVLPVLSAMVAPGGFLYLPINFDGMTRFEPTVDSPDFERRVEDLYHRTMDSPNLDRQDLEGAHGLRSQTGRHLLSALPAAGLDLVAADVCGWLVTPRAGTYADDEAFFVEFILDTVEGSIQASNFELEAPELERLDRWIAARREQLRRGELIYQTHQIDVLCRKRF